MNRKAPITQETKCTRPPPLSNTPDREFVGANKDISGHIVSDQTFVLATQKPKHVGEKRDKNGGLGKIEDFYSWLFQGPQFLR